MERWVVVRHPHRLVHFASTPVTHVCSFVTSLKRDGQTSAPCRFKHADWLRQLATTASIAGKPAPQSWPQSMQTSFDLSDAGWRQRLILVLPYLESTDPLASHIAWGELARAPYTALSAAKTRLPPTLVASWFEDPKLAQLQPIT